MLRTNTSIILGKIRDAGFTPEERYLYIYREGGGSTARIEVRVDPRRLCEDGYRRARLSDLKALADLFGVEDFTVEHGCHDHYSGKWSLDFTFHEVVLDRLLSEEEG